MLVTSNYDDVSQQNFVVTEDLLVENSSLGYLPHYFIMLRDSSSFRFVVEALKYQNQAQKCTDYLTFLFKIKN